MAPLVRTGGSRHTGLAALPHRNIQSDFAERWGSSDSIVCDKIYFFLCSLSFSIRFFHILSYFKQQKNPGNLTVPGYLTLGHNVPCGTQYILVSDYSMIVATRPDPTVRPPSRYQTGVLRYTNSDFLCDLCGKIRIFRCVRVVFRNFCYHGVITVFLVFLAYFFLHS